MGKGPVNYSAMLAAAGKPVTPANNFNIASNPSDALAAAVADNAEDKRDQASMSPAAYAKEEAAEDASGKS